MSNGNFSKGLDALPPKIAFGAGFVGGILVVLALGFIILLFTVLGDGSVNIGGGNNRAPTAAAPAAAAPSAPSPSLPSGGEPPAVTQDDHVRGNPNAPITLIEYSDYECPFCQRFHPTVQQVLEKYPDDVRWVYRHFPLSSLHPGAQKKAEASECAAELGGDDAFWKFSDAIFAQQPALSSLGGIAASIGVNEGAFQECLDSGRYADYVQNQLDGGSRAGVTGTPGTFVVGPGGESQLVPGALPFESFEQAIQSFL